ncbi:ABC transporter ATP-binding protein [Kiritimatiella glycovorans]|uniref:Multidrug export ATP-binding/permease protein n=1 Tax=Kiritimatiella glycovorans TaxID=1307763 RepID=A0A0G3EF99_9BACT|nr:ABC transporter ATP-binding protein [Kiritimatiella glycovorans]AKJ65131.1 Putative multidrug export ATP-binding/permease protein [Kiritimatiella glycovorans]
MMKSIRQMRETLGLFARFHREGLPPYRGKFYGIWVLHVLFAILLVLPPLVVRAVIDRAIPQKDIGLVWLAAGALMAIFALAAVIDWFRHYIGHMVAQRVTYRLRNNLYWHLQKLSFSFHDNIRVGELVSRLIDDLNRGEEVLYHAPQTWVTNTVTLVLTAALLLMLHPSLAAVCMVIVALVAFVAWWVSRRMFGAERRVREHKASLSSQAEENLSGVRIIQSFVRESHEMDRFEQENRGHYRSRMKAIFWWSWLFPTSILILGFALALALGLGGRTAILNPDAMTVGTLAAFVMYLQRLMFPLLMLFLINEALIQYFAGVERYFSFMDREPDITDVEDAVDLGRARGEVEFDGVWFRYDTTPVLRDIRLKVPPGETVALVGPSGTGKTTLTRLIPRFYEPYEGTLRIDGVDVNRIKLPSLRRNVGLVMQDDFLFSDTLYNNIAYGRLEATPEEIKEAARQANVDEFAQRLSDGYDTELGQRGVKISEGQGQRISIARAIVKNPPILILDEATSSVDSETERLIQEALERVMKDKTCFVIAHRLSTIVNADRICFIEDGRIIEEGTHDELIRLGGHYARYYELQSSGSDA